MGCSPLTKSSIVPTTDKQEEQTNNIKLKKKIMLSTDQHITHLNTVNEIKPDCMIVEEPYLKETKERKFREYADLLENPKLDFTPKEQFVAF